MTVRFLPAAAYAAAALGLAACSGTASNMTGVTGTPNSSVTKAAAMVASNSATGDANLIMPGSRGANLVMLDDDNPAAGCTLEILRWRCPPRVSSGLTVNSTVTFFDAANVQQAAYDTLTTASIHIDSDISGTVQHGSWTADVSRHRHFIVTGLLGTETTRTWNGFGSDTLHRTMVTDSTTTREFDVTVNTTVTNVVVPVGSGGRPTSGTITKVVTMTEIAGDQPGQTFTFTSTFTFNGSAQIPFSLGGLHFHLDLDADAFSEDH